MFGKKFLLVIFLIGTLAFPSISLGEMTSTDYTIFADSIDAGGVLSTGGDYALEDSLGESPVSSSTYRNGLYDIRAGYQAMDYSSLEASFSTSTIDLGTLDVTTVASSSMSVVVTTTDDGGYIMSGGVCGGSNLTGVSDGAVTAGNEEFGVSVTGVDAVFADDRMSSCADFNLAVSSTPVANVSTTLTFKAAISNATTAGSRITSFGLYVTVNF